MGDKTVYRLDLQHHAGTEAECIVIHLAVFIQRPVAQVLHVYLAKAFILRALDDGVVQRRLQQFRTSSDDINSHGVYKTSSVYKSLLLRV